MSTVMGTSELTEFDKFSILSEQLVPYAWFLWIVLFFIFLVMGFKRIEVRGSKRMLLTQTPFLTLGFVFLVVVAVFAISLQFFPLIPFWLDAIVEKVMVWINVIK